MVAGGRVPILTAVDLPTRRRPLTERSAETMRISRRFKMISSGVGVLGAAAALVLAAAPFYAHGAAKPKAPIKLFLDVHDLGPGKVTAEAVAAAHKKDLATQGKYGVHYQSYWFDEKEGKVYCLAEAPSAEAA